MEKDKSWHILVIIVLMIVIALLYAKNKSLKAEAEQLQDDYYSSATELRELKDEHDNLLSEHDDLETEHEEFKACVEDHVYDENYYQMKNTYSDCF